MKNTKEDDIHVIQRGIKLTSKAQISIFICCISPKEIILKDRFHGDKEFLNLLLASVMIHRLERRRRYEAGSHQINWFYQHNYPKKTS